MNVLFISHEKEETIMGGAGWSLFNMIQALQGQGVRAYVVMPKKGYAYDYFIRNGVESFVIPFKMNITASHLTFMHYVKYVPRWIRDMLANKRACNKITSIFIDRAIDIVHSNTSVIDIGPKIAAALGAKHVWHLREFQDKDFNMAPFRGWNRLLNQIHNSSGVIAITNAIYDHWRCHECINAVSKPDAVVDAKSEEIELKSPKKQIMLCGYLGSAKQPDMALRIFAMFYKKHTDYRFVLVGKFSSDEYEREIKQLIFSLGIECAVDIVGYTEDTAKYYGESRVLIMSSRNEAMGRVTIEAMFNGCIVLGNNAGGTAELIKDGETGFLFNNEREAIKKLSYICDNYEKMGFIRSKAYAFSVKNFSVNQYGKFLMDFYNGIAKRGVSPKCYP